MNSGKKMNPEIQLGKTENHHPNSNKTEDFPPLKDWEVGTVIDPYPKRQWQYLLLGGPSERGQRLGSDPEAG